MGAGVRRAGERAHGCSDGGARAAARWRAPSLRTRAPGFPSRVHTRFPLPPGTQWNSAHERKSSRKTTALASELHEEAAAAARDGETPTDVGRGCLQGCALSPLPSCLVLALALEDVETDPVAVDGPEVDHLACTDDVGATCDAAPGASATAQGIADASRDGADLHVDVGETETTKTAPKERPRTTTSENEDVQHAWHTTPSSGAKT